MKYNGSRTTNGHGQPTVYTFTIGKEELALLKAIVSSAKKYTPKMVETENTCNRLRNFMKVLNDIK